MTKFFSGGVGNPHWTRGIPPYFLGIEQLPISETNLFITVLTSFSGSGQ